MAIAGGGSEKSGVVTRYAGATPETAKLHLGEGKLLASHSG